MGFKDKMSFKILQGFNPVCPQRGPYEASEGIYTVMGREKNWGWALVTIRNPKSTVRNLQRNAFGAPSSEAIVILEHSLKIFSTDRLFIFAKGFVKESLWKGILLWVEAFAKIEFPSLILNSR